MRRTWCVPVAAFAIVGGSMLATTSAGAATHAAPRAAHSVVQPGGLAQHLVSPFGAHGVTHATSSNWSGFAVHSSTYKSVSASWTEPTGKCSGTSGHDYASFWVGLDGYNTNSVEQTGSDTDCSGGSAKYYGWYEMYPAGSVNINKPMKAGDKMSASVVFSGTSSFTLTLKDATAGWTATEHKSSSSVKRGSAEVIIEAPSSETGELPLADFGTVHFTASKVNGADIGNLKPTKITMVDGGKHLDKISALSGGANFSGTWLAS
jgi:Peptidase A4 family